MKHVLFNGLWQVLHGFIHKNQVRFKFFFGLVNTWIPNAEYCKLLIYLRSLARMFALKDEDITSISISENDHLNTANETLPFFTHYYK